MPFDQGFRDKLDLFGFYVRNVEVGGSNPLTSTIYCLSLPAGSGVGSWCRVA
jgi:hypothetical protein